MDRTGGLVSKPLLGLVETGRGQPERRIFGPEAVWPFGDPALAQEDRLAAFAQGAADPGPFLVGDGAGTGRRGDRGGVDQGHSSFGSLCMRSVTAALGG